MVFVRFLGGKEQNWGQRPQICSYVPRCLLSNTLLAMAGTERNSYKDTAWRQCDLSVDICRTEGLE